MRYGDPLGKCRCGKPEHSRGLCRNCYSQWRRNGSPDGVAAEKRSAVKKPISMRKLFWNQPCLECGSFKQVYSGKCQVCHNRRRNTEKRSKARRTVTATLGRLFKSIKNINRQYSRKVRKSLPRSGKGMVGWCRSEALRKPPVAMTERQKMMSKCSQMCQSSKYRESTKREAEKPCDFHSKIYSQLTLKSCQKMIQGFEKSLTLEHRMMLRFISMASNSRKRQRRKARIMSRREISLSCGKGNIEDVR